MATNFFFSNFQNSQEQVLIEDLIIESIKIYGLDMYFIPRNPTAIDKIYDEDPLREYVHSVPLEMYIKNVEGFAGEGDFLSKFNIEIRDQITFTISRRAFSNEVGVLEGISRPREGDLIYFPLNRKIFEIKFVEHEAIFYQLGALQTFDLKCELFEYNNEYFATGIDDIDRLMTQNTHGLHASAIKTESGLALTDQEGYLVIQESYDINNTDPLADNDEFQVEATAIIDFTELDPYSEGQY